MFVTAPARQCFVVCWSEGRFTPVGKKPQHTAASLRQVHVRVSSELKKGLKMFCAREGTTEQALLLNLIELELAKRAPDLWPARKASLSKSSNAAKMRQP